MQHLIPRRTRIVCLGLLLTFARTPSAGAQGNAFLPPAHGGVIAVSHTLEAYDSFWSGDRQITDDGLGRVETGSLGIWLQTGLSDDAALVASIALVDARGDGLAQARDQGLQDGTFLLRYRALSRSAGSLRHTLVGGAGLRIAASGYEPDQAIALGDGTTDVLLRLVYQVQLDSFWGTYLAVEGGYDARQDPAPNGTSLSAELGASFHSLSIAGRLMGTWADGGPDLGDPGFTYPSVDEEWLRVGGTVYYRVSSSFGLAVSGFSTFDGRNTGVSRGLSTSLVFQLPAAS